MGRICFSEAALRRIFLRGRRLGIAGDEAFPPDWPQFAVGKTYCVGGVDCDVTDIDGRQLTLRPQGEVWPRLSRFETVQLGHAELLVWKVSRKGIVLRHRKQCDGEPAPAMGTDRKPGDQNPLRARASEPRARDELAGSGDEREGG